MKFKKNNIFLHNETDVFVVTTQELYPNFSTLFSYLSSEEKIRMNRLLYEPLKIKYVVSHGFLRLLLGKYLSLSPSNIQYNYNEFKKPFCTQHPNLYFNMSHSNNYIAYAFSYNYKVGIDIEFIKNIPKIENLFSSIASTGEGLIFEKQNEIDKIYFFYKTWTIKEAFLKALGVGLTYPLSDIETSIIPKERFKVLKFDANKEALTGWTFVPIKFIPDYLGTVAVEKKDEKINFYTYSSLFQL